MKIPSYPLFEPLEKPHKPIFDLAFKNNPPEISEFTFINLYSWRHAYGFEYVNLEQDLGIEGLRRSKESYHPVRMVNKYTIKLRG
jgi:hypothetical protein